MIFLFHAKNSNKNKFVSFGVHWSVFCRFSDQKYLENSTYNTILVSTATSKRMFPNLCTHIPTIS